MNQSILVEKKPEIIYPDSDGKRCKYTLTKDS